MKALVRVSFLGFILLNSEQSFAQYFDPLDEVRFIPSTSWLSYVMSFLTIPIIYLIFWLLKEMIVIAWNSDKNQTEEEIEPKVLEKKQSVNKVIIHYINRFFEALIFVGITIGLGYMNFYYDIIYMKWYYLEDDVCDVGWFATLIWIVFQDLIKKGISWYKENSKL